VIIVTGGAGFIGSNIVAALNAQGHNDILVVDELGEGSKWKNLYNKRFYDIIYEDALLEFIKRNSPADGIEAVIHMGACTSTTERDADYLLENNYHYSVRLAEWALSGGVRFIYASSAAIYGDGNLGFLDDDEQCINYKPLNMYGFSKQLFDNWVIDNELQERVVGLRFFNVFGPNEAHKDDMASVAYKAFFQAARGGKVKLFKSANPDYQDGEQKRDFIYVKDCAKVACWFLENKDANGIFTLGTGKARSWNDLAGALFSALGKEKRIEYIDMPTKLIKQYQYFTEADVTKLRDVGYSDEFTSLEDAVAEYVQEYLVSETFA